MRPHSGVEAESRRAAFPSPPGTRRMRNAGTATGDTRRGAHRTGFRTGGIFFVLVSGTVISVSGLAMAQDAPQAPASATAGASHDIVLRMSVPASCRMTATSPEIRLTGRTDDGSPVDTTLSGQGGFVVDCNTPYAMSLARSPLYAAPSPGTGANGRPGAPAASFAAQGHAATQLSHGDGRAEALAGHMEVVIRVEGRGGVMESQCVMGAVDGSPYVCHAFAGPDDARLPPPRAAASLVVTGALAERGAVAGAGGGSPPAAFESAMRPAVFADGSVADPAARAASDGMERTAVRHALGQASGRRIGDRLTVSLSARY